MTDASLSKLVAGYVAAIEAAERNLSIARALAAGYRSGVSPPEVVLEAYLARLEADEAQLRYLRERVEAFRAAVEEPAST